MRKIDTNKLVPWCFRIMMGLNIARRFALELLFKITNENYNNDFRHPLRKFRNTNQ